MRPFRLSAETEMWPYSYCHQHVFKGASPHDHNSTSELHSLTHSVFEPNMESKSESNMLAAPYYDRAAATRTLCVIGLVLSWMLALCCIAVGIASSIHWWEISLKSRIFAELIILSQNILITICTDSLGYIHSISLRRALQCEGRLAFNSNLRLLTSSRTSGPNKWYSNVLVLCGIIAAYASSSLTFLLDSISFDQTDGLDEDLSFKVCGPAFVTLGCALAAQALVSTLALLSGGDIPTWSSALMDTAAACITTGPGLECRSSHSLRGVHHSGSCPGALYPRRRQRSAYSAHKDIRKVLWLVWFSVLLFGSWAAITVVTCAGKRSALGIPIEIDWHLLPRNTPFEAVLSWDQPSSVNLPGVLFLRAFFLISTVQAALTVAYTA